MIRSSSLPDAELCGMVPVLNRQHPRTYRNTIKGHAFHTKEGKQPDAKEAWERLTPDERAEVSEWKPVADWRDEDRIGHVTLRYADAQIEQLVGLDVACSFMEVQLDYRGEYVEVSGMLVPSRPDMHWVYDHPRGLTVAVGDIKTGEHAIPGGALSLQFVAPALALCAKHGADWFRTGIWYAREGRWEWSDPVHVDSDLAVELWGRIRRAASNPPVPVVGGHCSGCFQRQFCPAHMLPATQLETDLAPLVQPGGLTKENAPRAYLLLQALGKLKEMGDGTLKAWLADNGPVPLEGGKVLTLDVRQGREYADVAAIKADGLTKYLKRSRPYDVITVRKA